MVPRGEVCALGKRILFWLVFSPFFFSLSLSSRLSDWAGDEETTNDDQSVEGVGWLAGWAGRSHLFPTGRGNTFSCLLVHFSGTHLRNQKGGAVGG